MPSGSQRWTFTLNNPSDEEKRWFGNLPTSDLPTPIKGIAFQHEIAPDTGTQHIQGFLITLSPKQLHAVKNLSFVSNTGDLSTPFYRCHLEQARGSPAQNVAYCTKFESRDHLFGEPIVLGCCQRYLGTRGGGPAHLKRSELVDIVAANPNVTRSDLIDAGGLELLVTQPTLVGAIRSVVLENPRRDGVTVDFFVGPTGVGKSRLAYSLFPDAYRKASSKWWDGYEGQSVVVLDDFDSTFFPVGDLLRLLDRYPFRVEYKGGSTELLANHFVITSNLHPTAWYPELDERRRAAIYRRITRCLEFQSDGTIVEWPSYPEPWTHPPTLFTPPWAVEQ